MDRVFAYSDASYISVHNPAHIPVHFLGLELVVYVCFALTLRHAVSRHRAGDSYHLFQWLALFVYGVTIEIVAFNLFGNYEHGTFSVQLYHGQLPLYVTCIYLVFHYTGIKLIERLRLPLWREAIVAGLAIMLLDVPFDSLGVDAGWWTWADNTTSAAHPRFVEAVKTRWFGVPVSSYYWYLLYGALLVVLSRLLYPRLKNWRVTMRLAAAPLVSASVLVCGALAFELLFWLPRDLGASDHAIVAAYLMFAVAVAATSRAPQARRAEPWLLANAGMFYAYHLIVMVALWSRGSLSHGSGKLAAIAAAAAATYTIARVLPLSAPSGARASA